MTTTKQSTDTTTAVRGSILTTALEGFRARRAARAELTRIEQELSSYRTPAEIQELEAMFDRSGEADSVYTDVIQRLRQRAA